MIRSQTLLLRGLLMVSGLLLAGQTWAACTYSPRMNLGTLTVNPGLVQVAQAAAIGDVVSTTIVNIGGSYPVWIGQCDSSTGNGGFSISLSGTQGALVPGLLRVYNTNIQGIGYRIRTLGDNPNIWPTGTGVSTGTSSSIYVGWRSIQFELVKTAAVVGNGPLTPGEYGRIQVQGDPSKPYLIVMLGSARILSPTCSVDAGSQNITVPLGSVYRNAFQGVGSTMAVRNFSIRLNCNALPPGQGNTVMMTMDATADPSGLPGVLRLATGGPGQIAGGVGIQVRNALGNPVAFGQAVDVGPSDPAGYTIPFTARYIQTGSTVTTGDANGLATVTLTYK